MLYSKEPGFIIWNRRAGNKAVWAQRLFPNCLRSVTRKNVSSKRHKGFHVHRSMKYASRKNYTGANGDVDAAVLRYKLMEYLRH